MRLDRCMLQNLPAHPSQIAQGEQRAQLLRILQQAAMAHLDLA